MACGMTPIGSLLKLEADETQCFRDCTCGPVLRLDGNVLLQRSCHGQGSTTIFSLQLLRCVVAVGFTICILGLVKARYTIT